MSKSIIAPVGPWEDAVVKRKRGNRKDDVILVQTLLTNAAKATGTSAFDPKGVDGGIYKAPRTSGTLKAIAAFQKQFMRTPDSRVDPGGTTLKKLLAYANKPAVITNVKPGKYFSHAGASKVKLIYWKRAIHMTATAEELLKSILAASGIYGATLTSTKRTYHDQARITMTQTLPNPKRGPSAVKRWYGQDVLDACRLYGKTKDIDGFAMWWAARDKRLGRVSSKHLSNQALDVSPVKDREKFVKQVKALVLVSGSGVKRIIPKGVMKEPVDHVEFTFKVCP